MKNLSQNWEKFIGVICGPGSVVFMVLTVASLICAYIFRGNALFAALLSILGSLLAGIAGSFIRDDYTKLTTANVLEKKGRSALRNLEAIRVQIVQIRSWIASFKNVGKEGKKALEETDRHLSTIMLNIDAGLADWTDVVPELQERAEVVKKQEEVLRAIVEEILDNKKELVVSKDEKRVSELKKKITDLEKQINGIQKKDSWSEVNVMNMPSVSLGSLPYVSSVTGGAYLQTCRQCGRIFNSGEMGVVAYPVCSDCRSGHDSVHNALKV